MEFKYRGLTGKLDRHIVTDEEVDRHIERLLQQNARVAEVKDRPTQSGDEVVLDYAGYCDGVQFPGGTGENQTLVLGSGMFIPGFEEQLLDKVPGEQVTVNVTFPKEYHSKDLAGKDAKFECVIHQIRIKTPYEPDDVFAKEVGGVETFEELKVKLKESLQSYTDERGEMDLQDQLLRQAAETLDVTFTDEQLEAGIDEHMKALEAQLGRQGLSVEMYCSFMNCTEESLRIDARFAVEAKLKMDAAVDKIVQLEHLEATQEEIGAAVALVCRQNDLTVEQLKPYYNAEFEQAIIKSVLTSKVMQLIRDAAAIA